MKKLYFCILMYSLSLFVFSQEMPSGFYSFKLENGLELYIQEDYTVPSMSIEYISKAGTGRQTEQTTGFFQLYSRLFWKNNVSSLSDYDALGAGEFSSQSAFSQSRYSFVIPASSFEKGISLFSNALKHTLFLDSDILTEFNQLKQEVTTWASSVPGFINASVDSKVFSKEPWTKDSGVYPSLFSSNSIEDVRQKLSAITNNWYVPDQSALFITGPLSSSVVLEIISNYFYDWQSSHVIGNTSNVSKSTSAVQESDSNKLFVLVSSDFSKDYIQAVLQYTAPGLGASNEYSATAWTAAEIMQQKLLESGMTNTNTSFVAEASDSRIIIQTLFDAQSLNENTDISLMVPGFSNIVKTTAKLFDENDLLEAKNRATLFRNDAYTGAADFMEAVAANWAYGGVEYFFEWPQAVQSVTLHEVKQSFDNPWIFVLVHTDLYAKNIERFKSLGYAEITEHTGAWYTRIDENTDTDVVTQVVTPSTSVYNYSAFTKALIKQSTTSSGIPIVTQSIPSTPWTSVLLTIQGGEVLSGEHARGAEQIAVTSLKNSIENELSKLYLDGIIKTVPTVETDTEIYSSYISIVCLEEDLNSVLDLTANIIKDYSISVATADELFISSAYNWRIESGSLEYQLYAAAMETLFGGGKAQGLFNANTELMQNGDYNDIKFSSERIYDPKRLSLIFTGSIPENINEMVEQSFGKQSFYPIEKEFRVTLIEEEKPIFSPFEQVVRLRHTFLTDVPASLAGERPTKLIPTTDFSDPAQLYFEIPSFDDIDKALFISLLYEVADRITKELPTYRTPPALTVSVVPGTGKYPVSSLRFSKVKSRSTLKELTDKIFDELLRDLGKDDESLILTVKNRYTRILSREMITLNDRSHLIQQGINASNNPSLYLERFEAVENATAEKFKSVFEAFLTEGEFFWLFSADTAK